MGVISDGSWLDHARVRRIAWLCLAVSIVAIATLFATAHGTLDWKGRPLGTDFSQVWTAGTMVWDGRAAKLVAPNGRALGALQWRLSRRALLGEVQLRVDLKNPSLQFGGDLRRLIGDRQEWRNVALRIDLAAHQPALATPFGAPQGTLEVTVPYALLQGNWPLQLGAWAHWRDAAIRSGDDRVTLGDLRLLVQGEEGMVRSQMYDEGSGPLSLDGQLEVSPLGWRLDARLRPRSNDPALHRWLATLGRAEPDGTVHLQRRGGLAATLPPMRGSQP